MIFSKTNALFFITALSLGAVASAQESIYGNWHLITFEKDGFSVELQAQVLQDSVIARSKCALPDGGVLIVEVASPAHVNDSEIEVLETVEKVEKKQAVTCRATVNAGKIPYVLLDNGAKFRPLPADGSPDAVRIQ